MPNNELPALGTPEYYEHIRQTIIDLSNTAGIPVSIDDDGKPVVTGSIGLPKVQVPADPYAATSWGQPVEQDFTCPSGQRCLLRRVDIMELMGSGLLNNLDFLTSIVSTKHIPHAESGGRHAPPTETTALANIAKNADQLAEFQNVLRKIVVRVVVKPQIFEVPADGEERVNGRVYVDTVAMTDSIAIFNWSISGQSGEALAQFRESTGESVGDVESVEDVRTETVELPSDSKRG